MCTTMIVGKNASFNGSVIVSHSDDDVDDTRVVRVPSFNRKTRNVYYDNACMGFNEKYNSTEIRRYIGVDRGEVYNTESEGYENSKPIGTIPGFGKPTYAYFDSSYGISNEKGLIMGECTCGAKIQPGPEPGKRMFYSAELSRVALERCSSAREAIELMGNLIKNYGYYGTGETLLVGDADEGWVMEMCAYEEDGIDGIWVAQRVPDDEYFVAANQFRIRKIYRNSSDHGGDDVLCFNGADKDGNPRNDLIYSANLFKACNDAKWVNTVKEKNENRDEFESIDWAATVSYGEYSNPYYSLRRVWRAFSKVAPLSNLPSKVEGGYTTAYPFSLKPEKKLSVSDIAAIYRDHYEGTEFDLTRGIGAGPFRNAVRYENNPDQGDSFNLNTYKPKGAWERPLSIYRCGTLWINEAKEVNGNLEAVSWIGLDRPYANCLMPFDCKIDNLPGKLETMNLLEFDFKGNSAWWAFNFVANYINLNYEYMMREVRSLQGTLEKEAEERVADLFTNGNSSGFDSFCNSHCEKVIANWWDLATKLIVKFNNGCMTTGPTSIMEKIDYPEKWLKEAGFFEGPTEY